VKCGLCIKIDLCLPLRDELGVGDDCTIMKSLFGIEDEEDDGIEHIEAQS
jgi:hypothetical protein